MYVKVIIFRALMSLYQIKSVSYAVCINIKKITIGLKYPPFIIAEMSGNHNHSMERSLQIVDAARSSGVHLLKLQTYTPDTITLDVNEGEFVISDPESLWKNRSLYSLYKEACTPWEWHKEIFKFAKR